MYLQRYNFILMTLFCASNSLEFPCAFHTLMTLISGNLITIHITQVCKICAIYKWLRYKWCALVQVTQPKHWIPYHKLPFLDMCKFCVQRVRISNNRALCTLRLYEPISLRMIYTSKITFKRGWYNNRFLWYVDFIDIPCLVSGC